MLNLGCSEKAEMLLQIRRAKPNRSTCAVEGLCIKPCVVVLVQRIRHDTATKRCKAAPRRRAFYFLAQQGWEERRRAGCRRCLWYDCAVPKRPDCAVQRTSSSLTSSRLHLDLSSLQREAESPHRLVRQQPTASSDALQRVRWSEDDLRLRNGTSNSPLKWSYPRASFNFHI